MVTVLDRACELDGGESGGDATAAPAVEMDSVTVAASVTRSRPGFMGLAFPPSLSSLILGCCPSAPRGIDRKILSVGEYCSICDGVAAVP